MIFGETGTGGERELESRGDSLDSADDEGEEYANPIINNLVFD